PIHTGECCVCGDNLAFRGGLKDALNSVLKYASILFLAYPQLVFHLLLLAYITDNCQENRLVAIDVNPIQGNRGIEEASVISAVAPLKELWLAGKGCFPYFNGLVR